MAGRGVGGRGEGVIGEGMRARRGAIGRGRVIVRRPRPALPADLVGAQRAGEVKGPRAPIDGSLDDVVARAGRFAEQPQAGIGEAFAIPRMALSPILIQVPSRWVVFLPPRQLVPHIRAHTPQNILAKRLPAAAAATAADCARATELYY